MADVGFGTSVTFQSGFFAEIISVAWSGITRESIDTTHMATANATMTFMPSDIYNPGELTIEMAMDVAALDAPPPVTAAAETVTVTYPIQAGDSVAPAWACSGFMTGFDVDIPMEDRITATATIKLSGDFTVTVGAV